jgi:hypothetical protein
VESEALLQLTGDATNVGTLRLEHLNNNPNIEIIRGNTSSTNFNWNILNDNAFKLQSRNLATAYSTMFEISGAGDVGIGSDPIVGTKLNVGGVLNTTGNINSSGIITGSSLQGGGGTITQQITEGTVDMLTLRNDVNNTLRFTQTFIGANDMRFTIIQKTNNVDNPILNFRNGNIAIGTNSRRQG